MLCTLYSLVFNVNFAQVDEWLCPLGLLVLLLVKKKKKKDKFLPSYLFPLLKVFSCDLPAPVSWP